MAFGLSPIAEVGLTALSVWHALTSFCRQSFGPYDESPLMIPPTLATALLDGTATGFQCDGLRQLFHESNDSICCIFTAKNRWALLCGLMENQKLIWTYYLDGLRANILHEAVNLAWTLSSVLRLPCDSVEPISLQPQTLPYTCGNIAIMHLRLVLGLEGHFAPGDEQQLHSLLVKWFLFTCIQAGESRA